MQLIVILLAVVSVLTFLSGAIVFFGSKKGEHVRSTWFFLATIFATTWMASISAFLIAEPSWSDIIDWHVIWTFISAILIDVTFLGYVAWPEKRGQIITGVFVIIGLILSTVIAANPHLLYNEVVLDRAGNNIVMNIGPLYISYIIFFCTIVPAIVTMLLRQSFKTKSERKRGGDIVIMVSFAISSALTLVGDLILPLFGNWSMVWLGPLALSATIIAFYYTILRYRALNLSSIWLKIFSYIIIIASIAIIYMIIFAVIFAALFRGSMPSIEVIILNFIMILIFIALMPAMNEFTKTVRTLISSQHTTRKKDSNK